SQDAVLDDAVVEFQFGGPFGGRTATDSAFDATCLASLVQSSFPNCAGAVTARRVPPAVFGGSVRPGTHQTASSFAITGQLLRCDAGIFASVKTSCSFLCGGPAVRSPAIRPRTTSFLRRLFGTSASRAASRDAGAPRTRRQPFQIISRPSSMRVGGSRLSMTLSRTVRTGPYSRVPWLPGT